MIYPFSQTNSRKIMRIVSATAAAFLCATMFTGCFKKTTDAPSTDPSSGPNLVDSSTTEASTAPTAEATVPTTTEAPKTNVAVVKEQVGVRAAPTSDSNVLSTLNAGDEVEINRVESIGATQWAYIPLKGWVETDYLDMSNVTISGSTSTPANNNGSDAPTTTTAPTSTTGSNSGSTTTSGSTGTVTASELNIRQSPSTSATSVGKYIKGTQITILETSNGWGRTDKGWVNMGYVRMGSSTTTGTTTNNTTTNTGTTGTTTTTGGQKGIVTATQLNIRQSASQDAAAAGQYVYGDRITVLETSNGWGRTDKGWVSLNYVYLDGTTGSKTAKGLVTGNGLNVRSGPGTNYNSVATYGSMTRVNILEQIKVGNTTWGCTKDGWISLDYVYIDGTTGNGAGTGTVSGSNVNIRSGPGTNYNTVGSYNQGDTVEIYAQFTIGNMTWGCTSKGWVSMDYVDVG